MIHTTRRAALALALSLAGLPFAAGAAGPAWPDKPIRMIVPFAAGGGVDVLARPLAKELGDILKQTVYVENKASATGQIGTNEVARAQPDGYTVLISSAAYAITPAYGSKLPYDVLKDLEPVTIVASSPQIVIVNPAFKANSVADVIRIAQAGGQINFALTGSTGIQALAAELMSSMGKISFTKIPYKGAGAAITDLLGGQVDMMIDNPASSMPHVRAGKMKLLATTGLKRMAVLPDVPTVAETLPGFEALNWFVLSVPANTPAAVVDRLHAAVQEAVKRPSLRQLFDRDGLDPVMNSRAEARAFVATEVGKWSRIVKERGLQIE